MFTLFKKAFALSLLCLLFIATAAQAQSSSPKREFRAVWVASVANIDWPSQKGLSPVTQQKEFTYIADTHQKNGMNALIVQIRPAADAFYRSKLEPWSEWLTGMQGQELNPPYDPLDFMLQQTHERGMEFHAWFNPYRATFSPKAITAPDHITKRKPEWFIRYEGKLMFDPGIPEVRTYITSIIMDVVRRYDIDGVHFDDYFYPYPIANTPFPDDSTFLQHPNGFSSKSDWRRNNVDLLIKGISDSIQAVKPYLKFGISPFGVWKNKGEDVAGSATRAGAPTYSTLYADTRKWMQLGWIDYLVPQVYWHIGHKAADYKTIVEWWGLNSFNRHLYIGHGAYKLGVDSNAAWQDQNEIPRQLRLNRSLPTVGGSVYFSSKSIMKNTLNVQDSLRAFYRYPALVPVMDWKKSKVPAATTIVKAQQTTKGVHLQWQQIADARYYVIYRFEKNSFCELPIWHKEYWEPFQAELNNPARIVGRVFGNNTHFLDRTALEDGKYTYVITTLDRLQNESAPSAGVTVRYKNYNL